jgi:2-polyprenyl-6-methoxyphenol hydroxylase-like FAD-dependent oxidoreductase
MIIAKKSKNSIYDYLIIGAGATGLMLALMLQKRGFSVIVAEQRLAPVAHSRSIGIHPPSLEILEELGLLHQFIDKGVSVRSGLCVVGGRESVTLPMCSGVGTDRILVLPQQITEQLLESALQEGTIVRGLRYTNHNEIASHVSVEFSELNHHQTENSRFKIECRYLIAADGMYSKVRDNADISLKRNQYPWPYAMGDFPDATGFGDQAVIFLSKQGLTESFPMPGGLRRWVINLAPDDPILDDNSPDGVWHGYRETSIGGNRKSAAGRSVMVEDLTERIFQRTGHQLQPADRTMFSVFSIYRGVADRLWKGRVILVGDAAHVISPIGGQGMNMAWLSARNLVDLVERYGSGEPAFSAYSRSARRRYRKFANRAEFNTRVGRPGHPEWFLNLAVRTLSSTVVRGFTARRFTMR